MAEVVGTSRILGMLHGFVMRKSWPGPLAAVLILDDRSEFVRVQGETQTLSRVGLAVCMR